jgi:hypothetical protein
MTDTIDQQIHQLVAELMDSAPQAPPLPELEWGGAAPRSRQVFSRTRWGPLLTLGGLCAVVAIAAGLLLTILWPGGPIQPTSAAAEEFQTIATNAAKQTIPQPGPGQWLYVRQKVSAQGDVSQIGSTPTLGAVATFVGYVEEWTNAKSSSCVLGDFGAPQFATPANRAAWIAAGMLADPIEHAASCASVEGGTSTDPDGGGAFNVSNLSTDPATLAHQLTTGSTGIAGLDQITPGLPNQGFARAVHLLIGPTSGNSSAVTSAIYGALAYIPGVKLVGTLTSHAGSTGIGFSGPIEGSESIVIIDPSTGALLEVQNIPAPLTFNGLGGSLIAPPPTPSIGTEGGSARTTIQWLDPIGSPTVVASNSLPAGAKVNGSTAWLN